MQNFTRWFLGKELYDGWKWLWGVPSSPPVNVKTSDEIILEEITQSLKVVRIQVKETQKIVDGVRHDTQEHERQYNLRQQYYQELINKVSASKQDSSLIEVREMMANAIQIKRGLPQQKIKLEHLQQIFIDISESYAKKQSELLLLELDLQAAATRMAINKSIDGDPCLDNAPDLIVLQEKIQYVSEQAEDHYQKAQLMIHLSSPSDCVLLETLSLQDIDDHIARVKQSSVS
jgi:hypothetical protein